MCIFVGYADQHASDCYQMFNPTTKRIRITRDVRWLKRWYYDSDGSVSKTSAINEELTLKIGKGIERIVMKDETLMRIEEENETENETNTNTNNQNNNNNVNQATTTIAPPSADAGWTRVTRGG